MKEDRLSKLSAIAAKKTPKNYVLQSSQGEDPYTSMKSFQIPKNYVLQSSQGENPFTSRAPANVPSQNVAGNAASAATGAAIGQGLKNAVKKPPVLPNKAGLFSSPEAQAAGISVAGSLVAGAISNAQQLRMAKIQDEMRMRSETMNAISETQDRQDRAYNRIINVLGRGLS